MTRFNFSYDKFDLAYCILLDDIRSRAGLREIWDTIDFGTQLEIKNTWVDYLKLVFKEEERPNSTK